MMSKYTPFGAKYKFDWETQQEGLPFVVREWLDRNCQHPWGWRFIKGYLIISFEHIDDLVQAKLCIDMESSASIKDIEQG